MLVRSLVTGVDPVFADGAGLADTGLADTGLAEADGCDYASFVPTQLRRLLAAGARLDGFAAILLGGAATPADLLRDAAAAGARVVSTYGMTETCGGCVYDGVPLDGVEVASGAGGVVRISGPVLFSRYRLAPELTAASLADGWFVTSDLGEVGPDGRLVLAGRADDVINTGGEKVVPVVVEEAIRGLRTVGEVAVVGVPDPDWGERVTAIVVPADPASPPSLDELRSHVRERLPRYAAPQALVCVARLPMLASGKPDRIALRSVAAGAAAGAGAAPGVAAGTAP